MCLTETNNNKLNQSFININLIWSNFINIQETRRSCYLISTQLDSYCDVNGVVDHTHDRSDQWNEEKGKPDDADQEEDNKSTHAIFHYLLFLLAFRLWVFLRAKEIVVTKTNSFTFS